MFLIAQARKSILKTILLGFIREMRTEGKQTVFPQIRERERQAHKGKESRLTRADRREQTLHWEPVPG